jgi:hypothetical protein
VNLRVVLRELLAPSLRSSGELQRIVVNGAAVEYWWRNIDQTDILQRVTTSHRLEDWDEHRDIWRRSRRRDVVFHITG